MSQEIEIEILRERLREYIDLLSVSHSLLFNPHDSTEKRQNQLNLYKQKLLENGIIKDEQSSNRN